MARDPNPSPSPNVGTAVWGWNGTDWEVILVDPDGHLQADLISGTATIDGSVSVDNFPATQPVSGLVSVGNFPTVISGANVPVTGEFYPATQPVSATGLPLPTGAATEAKQLSDNHQVLVSNFPGTQPISGNVGVISSVLPSGAATETALQSILTELGQKTEPANIQKVSLNGERVAVDPMTDYDTVITYTTGKMTEIVVTGGGKTKTMVIGWTGENLTSIATTIT